MANAILDGTDCIMLSGETTKGSYPVQSGEYWLWLLFLTWDSVCMPVLMMVETCLLAEHAICYLPLFDKLCDLQQRPTETAETVSMAAVAVAFEQNASALLVLLTSGNTVRLLSKYRPNVPVICGVWTPTCIRNSNS